jgi:hypothetical protein
VRKVSLTVDPHGIEHRATYLGQVIFHYAPTPSLYSIVIFLGKRFHHVINLILGHARSMAKGHGLGVHLGGSMVTMLLRRRRRRGAIQVGQRRWPVHGR